MKISALICVLGLWSAADAADDLQAQVEQARLLLEQHADAQGACTMPCKRWSTLRSAARGPLRP